MRNAKTFVGRCVCVDGATQQGSNTYPYGSPVSWGYRGVGRLNFIYIYQWLSIYIFPRLLANTMLTFRCCT